MKESDYSNVYKREKCKYDESKGVTEVATYI